MVMQWLCPAGTAPMGAQLHCSIPGELAQLLQSGYLVLRVPAASPRHAVSISHYKQWSKDLRCKHSVLKHLTFAWITFTHVFMCVLAF